MKTNILVWALAAVLAAAVAGVIAARPADAFPNKQKDCAACHGSGGYAATVTATPNSSTVAPGATYTVAITISENPNGTFKTGYWIADSDASGSTGTTTGVYGGDTSAQQSHTATMTAPSTPGTYYYKVFAEDGKADDYGVVGFKVYSVTVATTGGDAAVYLGAYPRVRRVFAGDVGGFFAVWFNHGTASATFTATLSATSPLGATATLDARSLTLAAGESLTVYYPGVLTYTSAGMWTTTASASLVPGEAVTHDNTYVRLRPVLSAPPASPRHVERGRH